MPEMTRRSLLEGAAGAALAALPGGASMVAAQERRKPMNEGGLIGMYVHQHWPYNHPYAARTWTLADWQGYLTGIHALGYNAVMVWPVLETMPDPLTSTDQASIRKIAQVIDYAQKHLEMVVWLALCPNVGVNSAEARRASFEKRHFFYCDTRVNPADADALDRLVRWRERLLKPLAHADGVSIIDSDPGGYPGSTNAEFVYLLGEHRKMLDRLRPGIELIYWMHAGWEAYGRFYQTGHLALGSAEEHEDCLRRLKELNPEPWSIANGLTYAEKLSLASRVISYNYGRIEGEPSFPRTNFGGTVAYDGGRDAGPRGVMGNAQTHCVQLPNTFAFARGAQGLTLTDQDYIQFADGLIPGQGELIVAGWRALAGRDSGAMRQMAPCLESAAGMLEDSGSGHSPITHHPSPLQGLLFGSPRRFLTDLVLQLRYQADLEELAAASEAGKPIKPPLATFLHSAEAWQHRHGYQNSWWEPRLFEALRKLDWPELNAALNLTWEANPPLPEGRTAFQQVALNLAEIETQTPRLLAAIRSALGQIP